MRRRARVAFGLGLGLGLGLFIAAVAAPVPARAAEDGTGGGAAPDVCRDGDKAAVVFFVLTDCPVSNALAPEMSRIAREYSERGVRFTFAYVDPALDAGAAGKHASEYRLAAPHVVDRDHRLVAKARAEVVPEAVVFTPEGEAVYHGRINNQFTGFGQKRQVVTEHDLRVALDAVLAGSDVPAAKGEAVGCYIADYAPAEDGDDAGESR